MSLITRSAVVPNESDRGFKSSMKLLPLAFFLVFVTVATIAVSPSAF